MQDPVERMSRGAIRSPGWGDRTVKRFCGAGGRCANDKRVHQGAVRSRNRAGGFSLMEVLVAVLILSVGIMGLAQLQFVSLQNNTNSLLRTRAVIHLYEMIDRARANPGQDYSIAMDDPAPGGVDCEIQDCIPSQLRDYDQTVWKNDLAALLPGGNGSVVAAGGTLTVTVQWQDDRGTAGADPLEVSATTIL